MDCRCSAFLILPDADDRIMCNHPDGDRMFHQVSSTLRKLLAASGVFAFAATIAGNVFVFEPGEWLVAVLAAKPL